MSMHNRYIPTRCCRQGFTLVELLVCIALLALTAGLVSLSLRSRHRDASINDAVRQIGFADQLLRHTARILGNDVELRLGLGLDQDGSVNIRSVSPRQREVVMEPVHLPRGLRIERVCLSGRSFDRDAVTITCSSRGQTPTYAMLLGSGEKKRWIIVTGLGGELYPIDDERKIEQILASCTQGRHAR